MNKYWKIIESIILIAILALSFTLLKTFSNREKAADTRQDQSVPVANDADKTGGEESMSGIEPTETGAQTYSIEKLMSMFLSPQRKAVRNDAPEKKEKQTITPPRIRYVGKLQLGGDETTFLFDIENIPGTSRMKTGSEIEGIKLTGVRKDSGGTVFTFTYNSASFTVTDRD